MSNWHEEIPYGPLTKADFDKLGTALIYKTSPEEVKVAHDRGINEASFLMMQVGEVAANFLGTNDDGEVNDDW